MLETSIIVLAFNEAFRIISSSLYEIGRFSFLVFMVCSMKEEMTKKNIN